MEISSIQPTETLLIFPPRSEAALQAPHIALPQLVAYLHTRGIESRYLDLNIRFFRYLASVDFLTRQMEGLAQQREAMHQRSSLSEGELHQLLELSRIDRLKAWLDGLSSAGPDRSTGTVALRHIDDLLRCHFLLTPLMKKLPGAFEDILLWVAEARNSVITAYYDQLDLARLCTGVSLVGIGTAFHLQLYPALELARRIKAARGDGIKVVLGGSLAALLKDSQKRTLAQLAYIDALVVHEGELPLLRICEQLGGAPEVDFSKVPNVYYQSKKGSVHAPWFDVPVAMGDLPTPAFNAEELDLYLKPVSLPVYVSKGCYWGKCKFCDYTKLYSPGQPKFTTRPLEKLTTDIEALTKRHHIKSILLISEAIPPAYYRGLSERLTPMRLEAEFWSYCRVEKNYTPDFFQSLYQAGVRNLTFGVESTSDRILELINKGNTVADVRRSIRLARAAGIDVCFNLIPDYPTITWQEVTQTIAFVRENIDFITSLNYQFFDLSINSAIAEDAEAHGISLDEAQAIRGDRGVHSMSFSRKSGLSQEETERVKQAFNLLSREIALYKRCRELILRVNADNFDWHASYFTLVDDLEVYRLHFDPAAPIRTNAHETLFRRLDAPLLVMASPSLRRYLSCTPGISQILDVSRQRGLFCVDDVIAHIKDQFGPESAEDCRIPLVSCLKSMVTEGFVQDVFQPWADAGAAITTGGSGVESPAAPQP